MIFKAADFIDGQIIYSVQVLPTKTSIKQIQSTQLRSIESLIASPSSRPGFHLMKTVQPQDTCLLRREIERDLSPKT
jgi:hypothetical protein